MSLTIPRFTSRDYGAFLRECQWYQVFDVAEAMWTTYAIDDAKTPYRIAKASEFRTYMNVRLLRFYSAYEMNTDGRVYEPGSMPAEAVVAEARGLLRDPRFAGPDRQFQAAIEAMQQRTQSNFETVMTNAYNATEGVARIVLNDRAVTLGEAVKQITESKKLHKALGAGIASLYGYASDEAGRHGLVGESPVDRSIAEYCLHQAAATIVLFARLFNEEVVTG